MRLFAIFTAVTAAVAIPIAENRGDGTFFPPETPYGERKADSPSTESNHRPNGVQFPNAETWDDVSLFYGELRVITWAKDKSQIAKKNPEVPENQIPGTPNRKTPNSENSYPFQDFDPAQITSDVLNGAYKYTLWPTLGAGAAALLNLLGGGGGGVGVPTMPSIPDVGAYSGN
ncbi:hypothetical protein MMC22_000541 [Lobaria immixta]|nr:hypothetical protein [Lobaria immixta]